VGSRPSRTAREGSSLPGSLPPEPRQNLADAPGRQGHAGIRRAVVEANRLAILPQRAPTRERDVVDVAFTLVGRFGPEYPRVAPSQTAIG
jgi:hypothetical protein